MSTLTGGRRVECRSPNGLRYAYWEYPVPRIPDVLLPCVVFMYADETAAREGRAAGGTGFLVRWPTDDDDEAPGTYLVTNLHVVLDGFTTARIKTVSGGSEPLALPRSKPPWAWKEPNDVAVAAIDLTDPRWAAEPIDLMDFAPTPERFEELNVGIGDEVFMLGRFVSHKGDQSNEPVARFGSIAMMAGELVRDGRGNDVEAYLAEMRSIPGFSGSPTFINIPPASWRGNGTMMPFYAETVGLLGIDTGHKGLWSPLLDKRTKKPDPNFPDWGVSQNTGIATICPTSKIIDLLDSRRFVNERKRRRQNETDDQGDFITETDSASGDEFDAFQSLARKIVQVPKSEIDEQRDRD